MAGQQLNARAVRRHLAILRPSCCSERASLQFADCGNQVPLVAASAHKLARGLLSRSGHVLPRGLGMPVDDIAEGALRLLGRLLWEFLVEVVFEVVCYGLGFGTLRLATFGKYPPADSTTRQDNICALVGLLELIAAAIAVALHLNA